MRFDLYEQQRNEAKVLENGLKVLQGVTKLRVRGESEKVERPNLKIWKPKAKKPYVNYYYPSLEIAEEQLNKYVENYKHELEEKEKYKQARKGTPEQLAKIKVGDVFHDSWGYDQTNVNYYQVISKKNRHVEVREIGAKRVEGSEGFMSCKVVPDKDNFLNDSPVLKKLIQFSGETPYLKIRSYGWCSLQSGEDYCSWYA